MEILQILDPGILFLNCVLPLLTSLIVLIIEYRTGWFVNRSPREDHASKGSLARILTALNRRWWIVLLMMVISTFTTYVFSRSTIPVYRSTINVSVSYNLVTFPTNTIVSPLELEDWAKQSAVYAKAAADGWMEEAKTQPGLDPAFADLRISRNGQVIIFTVESSDSVSAERIASKIVEIFISSTRNSYPNYVELTTLSQKTGTRPIRPNILFDVYLSAVLGLILAIGLLLFMDKLENNMESPLK